MSRPADLHARRAVMASAVRALADSLGRDPTIKEMAGVVFPDRRHIDRAAARNALVYHWGAPRDWSLAGLRERAGIRARQRGTPGHVRGAA